MNRSLDIPRVTAVLADAELLVFEFGIFCAAGLAPEQVGKPKRAKGKRSTERIVDAASKALALFHGLAGHLFHRDCYIFAFALRANHFNHPQFYKFA